jgi:hypothetical protein
MPSLLLSFLQTIHTLEKYAVIARSAAELTL